MSASNWSVCPKCHETHISVIDVAKMALNEAYGKVSLEKYNELLAKLREVESLGEQEEPETLREDYDQGIVDSEYFVSYKGHCQVCHFEFVYKHKEKIKTP